MLKKILTPSASRFVQAQVEFPSLVDFYNKHEQSFWTSSEINLTQDRAEFNALTTQEQFYLKAILAFFAVSDGMVNENLALNFYNEVQHSELRSFWAFQIAMENIHAKTYTLIIMTYIDDVVEQNRLFTMVETHPCIAAKAAFVTKYMDKSIPFVLRLVAFACVEGIFFSPSFCSIFWFKKRGLLHGLSLSNDFISRDEGLHRDFACEVYRLIDEQSPLVEEIVKEATNLECDFVKSILPHKIGDMDADSMCQYVRYCADLLLKALGHPIVYHDPCPYIWMITINLDSKKNFFEQKPTEYSRADVVDYVFSTNEDV